jgi:glycine/D-amino acid oxidase-like deaminating enzyme
MKQTKPVMKSLWMDYQTMEAKPPLSENIFCEILVVGGGMAGVSIAYELEKRGHSVVLVEKNRIGEGITGKTTAFVSAIQDTLLQDRVKKIGYEKTKDYVMSQLAAIDELEFLSKNHSFDFQRVDLIQYQTKNDPTTKENPKTNKNLFKDTLFEEAKLYDEFGIKYEIAKQDDVFFPVEKALRIKNQAIINPMKLLQSLSKSLQVYEHTEIVEVKNKIAYTKSNRIHFHTIIYCTHFPITDLMKYSLRLTQTESYVAVIKDKHVENCLIQGINTGDLYFRRNGDKLIIGGYDAKTATNQGGYKAFIKKVNNLFPDQPILYSWVNEDIVTFDDVFYAGPINKRSRNAYVVTGFNLWGMASSFVSSKIIADEIEGKHNPYAQVYDNNRSLDVFTLLSHVGSAIKNEVKLKKPRCSHLGCALEYDEGTRNWVCPCHGSRYDESGQLLIDPASKSLKETDLPKKQK